MLILTPAAAESIDTMVCGVTGGSADFVFAPGQFAPGTLFGLQRRVCKTIPAPAVVDSAALGKLYVAGGALGRLRRTRDDEQLERPAGASRGLRHGAAARRCGSRRLVMAKKKQRSQRPSARRRSRSRPVARRRCGGEPPREGVAENFGGQSSRRGPFRERFTSCRMRLGASASRYRSLDCRSRTK